VTTARRAKPEPTRPPPAGTQVSYGVGLLFTSLSSGGHRWRWMCPRCDRRVDVLYLPPDRERLACRRCCGLVYRSQYTRGRSGGGSDDPRRTWPVRRSGGRRSRLRPRPRSPRGRLCPSRSAGQCSPWSPPRWRTSDRTPPRVPDAVPPDPARVAGSGVRAGRLPADRVERDGPPAAGRVVRVGREEAHGDTDGLDHPPGGRLDRRRGRVCGLGTLRGRVGGSVRPGGLRGQPRRRDGTRGDPRGCRIERVKTKAKTESRLVCSND
jgi:hypothetical protein